MTILVTVNDKNDQIGYMWITVKIRLIESNVESNLSFMLCSNHNIIEFPHEKTRLYRLARRSIRTGESLDDLFFGDGFDRAILDRCNLLRDVEGNLGRISQHNIVEGNARSISD